MSESKPAGFARAVTTFRTENINGLFLTVTDCTIGQIAMNQHFTTTLTLQDAWQLATLATRGVTP